jgi:cytoskeleton-associated protein 5
LPVLSFYGHRSDIAEQSGEVVSRSVTGSMISRCSNCLIVLFIRSYVQLHNATCLCLTINRDLGYADAHMDRHMVPRQIPAATGPADWHEALDIVALGLPEQVMLLITSHSPPIVPSVPSFEAPCLFLY